MKLHLLLRVAIAVVAAAILGAATGLIVMALGAGLFQDVGPSRADVAGFGVLALISSLLLATCFHTPTVLLAARRYRWSRRTSVFWCALPANVLPFTVLAIGYARGMYGGLSEVVLFVVAYVVTGVAVAVMLTPRA